MYYNDSVSKTVKNCIKKKRKYKEVKINKETTPLLKNNNDLTWDVKVQVEETTLSTSSAASTASTDTLMDGKRMIQLILKSELIWFFVF